MASAAHGMTAKRRLPVELAMDTIRPRMAERDTVDRGDFIVVPCGSVGAGLVTVTPFRSIGAAATAVRSE